jgi:CheY-like chemotaxis protein
MAETHKKILCIEDDRETAALIAEELVDRGYDVLAAAEAADAQEDEIFAKDKRGDEMPDWASDKEKRLAKIQEAMAALEADAKLAAEEERRIEAEKEQQRNAEGRKKPGKPAAPLPDEPDPKAQRNFTDPDSRIMKSKEGFVQAYNAQAAVDADAQIIVAHELTPFRSRVSNPSANQP